MKRQPTPSTDDSQMLHGAIDQIITEHGRGGLAWVARELGMTSSALRKRMRRPGTAFDSPSLRAAILVMELTRQRQEAQTEPPSHSEDTPAPGDEAS